jgi:hypothetical protein
VLVFGLVNPISLPISLPYFGAFLVREGKDCLA